ncbi:MAG: hypothetical protein ACJASD_002951 [Sphingomonas echinoides]
MKNRLITPRAWREPVGVIPLSERWLLPDAEEIGSDIGKVKI